MAEGEVVSPVRALASTLTPLIRANWPLLLVGLILTRLLWARYSSPLRSYPGPLLASCSRLWKFWSTATCRTHLDHIELHRRYGPVVRIAPNEVSLSSPQAARAVLSAGKRFYKTDFYAVFPPPENPDIFTEIREHVHAQKKKVANVPYSMAAMRQLSPFIDDTIDLLVSRLTEFCPCPKSFMATPGALGGAAKGGQVNLGDWLHYFAFDVLGEVAFSRSFGFLSAGLDVESAIKTIDDSQRYNGLVGQVPELDKLLRRNPLWKLIPALDPGNALITRIAFEEMAKRQPFGGEKKSLGASDADDAGSVGEGRRDLLASLIQGHLKDESKFTKGDVFAVAHGAIFAGSDSTASTMQSFFYQVLSSPRVHAALVAEIEQAVAAGTIPATGNIEWTEAQSLPYLQACLKEAMRVRPAVGLNITRLVPPEGVEIEGQFFRGGTRVALNGWVLHRDRDVFGQDAEVYRPERWLEDEEEAKTMERYMFQFGGGAHVCIGRNLALLEMNKVLPRLLRDFKFELMYPNRELKAKATFFVVQEGLEVYIEKKNASMA